MFALYILVGIVGGVLGGMGMGGGTLLIPMLGIFFGLEQHVAQAINLISFIPMSIIAIFLHIKNKLIDFNKILWIIIPGVFTCVAGSFVSKAIDGDVLKRIFGGFLIALAFYQFYTSIKE